MSSPTTSEDAMATSALRDACVRPGGWQGAGWLQLSGCNSEPAQAATHSQRPLDCLGEELLPLEA